MLIILSRRVAGSRKGEMMPLEGWFIEEERANCLCYKQEEEKK